MSGLRAFPLNYRKVTSFNERPMNHAMAIIREYVTCEESWWIGLPRETFYAALKDHALLNRMRHSQGSAWVVSGRIYEHYERKKD